MKIDCIFDGRKIKIVNYLLQNGEAASIRLTIVTVILETTDEAREKIGRKQKFSCTQKARSRKIWNGNTPKKTIAEYHYKSFGSLKIPES